LGDKNNLEEFLDEKKDTIRDSLGWFSSWAVKIARTDLENWTWKGQERIISRSVGKHRIEGHEPSCGVTNFLASSSREILDEHVKDQRAGVQAKESVWYGYHVRIDLVKDNIGTRLK
jgi:hypothetical protein